MSQPSRQHQVAARRDERGSASIELVILLPALFAVMFLGMQAALFYHARTVAIAAAQEGAKAAGGENGKEADGVSAASAFVDEAGGDDVLTGATATANRTATTVTVTVDGHSLSVIPGWNPRDRPVGLAARGEADGTVTIWRRIEGRARLGRGRGRCRRARLRAVRRADHLRWPHRHHPLGRRVRRRRRRPHRLDRAHGVRGEAAMPRPPRRRAWPTRTSTASSVDRRRSTSATSPSTVGEAGSVSATVECRLDLADLSVPGVPGSRLIKATMQLAAGHLEGARMMRRTRDERGSISIWLAVSSFVMMILVGLAVDLGGQVHAKQRAHDIAAEAARTGGEQVQAAPAIEGQYVAVDTVAARNAAEDYLAAAGVTGTVTVTGGDTITVDVTDTYSPKFLSFIGIGDLTVTSQASARLIRSLGGSEQ